MSLHVCECGRSCKSAGGLASHQRSCLTHLDAVRVGATQLELLPAAVTGRGAVETAAYRDVTTLRAADMLGDDDAVSALELTYVLLGREIDRAELEKDRYGKINTAAKLIATRRELSAFGPELDASTVDEFFDRVSANLRDTAEP